MQLQIMEQHEEQTAYFEIGDLLAYGFTIGILTIGMSYMILVNTEVRDEFTVDTVEYNATVQGIEAQAKIPAKLGLITTIVIAAIIIGLLMRYLYMRFTR